MKAVFYFMLFLTLVFSTSSYASPCSEVFSTKAKSLTTREEIESLTEKEIQELTLKEIKELGSKIRYLKTKQITLFKGKRKIGALPFWAMTAEQRQALIKEQLQDIPLKVLKNPIFISVLIELTAKQITMFKPEQVEVLPLWEMTKEQIQALTKEQVQALRPQALKARILNTFVIADGFEFVIDLFSTKQIPMFKPKQVKSLPFYWMSPEQTQALTVEQIPAIPPEKIKSFCNYLILGTLKSAEKCI